MSYKKIDIIYQKNAAVESRPVIKKEMDLTNEFLTNTKDEEIIFNQSDEAFDNYDFQENIEIDRNEEEYFEEGKDEFSEMDIYTFY